MPGEETEGKKREVLTKDGRMRKNKGKQRHWREEKKKKTLFTQQIGQRFEKWSALLTNSYYIPLLTGYIFNLEAFFLESNSC